jgi:hypothetical protein
MFYVTDGRLAVGEKNEVVQESLLELDKALTVGDGYVLVLATSVPEQR